MYFVVRVKFGTLLDFFLPAEGHTPKKINIHRKVCTSLRDIVMAQETYTGLISVDQIPEEESESLK